MQIEATFWAWALVSVLIGLGFTVFSGAVEAWLVDALATGFTGSVESVFGRGQVVSGAAMLGGSVAGGFIAEQSSLAVPFVLRGLILIAMSSLPPTRSTCPNCTLRPDRHDLSSAPPRAGPITVVTARGL